MLVTSMSELTKVAPVFSASDADKRTAYEFTTEIGALASAYGWNDQQTLRLATLMLRNVAKEWYLEQVAANPFTSFEDFSTRFHAMFQLVDAKESTLAELRRTKQQANESVWSFRGRLFALFRRFEKAGGELSEDSKLMYFQEKLLPIMQQALAEAALHGSARPAPNEPMTIDSAVSYLQRWQETKKQVTGRKYGGYTADGSDGAALKANAVRFDGNGGGYRPPQHQRPPQQYRKQAQSQYKKPPRVRLPQEEYEYCMRHQLCFKCRQHWEVGHECTSGALPNGRRAQ